MEGRVTWVQLGFLFNKRYGEHVRVFLPNLGRFQICRLTSADHES